MMLTSTPFLHAIAAAFLKTAITLIALVVVYPHVVTAIAHSLYAVR